MKPSWYGKNNTPTEERRKETAAMRFLAFVLFLQVSNGAMGFSPVVNSPNPPRAALFAATANQNDFDPRAADIALTLALGWVVGSSPSLAVPSLDDPSPSHHLPRRAAPSLLR
jgi:hypothetical protein